MIHWNQFSLGIPWRIPSGAPSRIPQRCPWEILLANSPGDPLGGSPWRRPQVFPQGDPRGIPQGDVPGEPPSPQGSLLGNPSGRPLGEVTQGDHLWDPPRGFTGGPSWLLAVPRCGDFKESAAEMSGILKVTILGSPTAQVEAVQAEDPPRFQSLELRIGPGGFSTLGARIWP